MKRALVFSVALAILSGGIARAAEAPSVDEILAKYIKEMGGKEAIEKVKSRMLKIKVQSEPLGEADGEIYAKMPNKQTSRIKFADTDPITDGFDGKVAWAKTPWDGGVREKTGDELAKVKRDAEFHRELAMKKVYPDLAYKGTEKVGDEEAYVLESKPTATSKERLFFSRKSGLLVRQESRFEAQPGVTTVVVVDPRDYKTADGLKFPSEMKLTMTIGEQTFNLTIKIVEVKHNVEIDDSKFAKPSA